MLSEKIKYNMNFTVGSLLIYPSLEFISLYLKHKDYSAARKEALILNITQSEKISSAKRIITEIQSRIRLLGEDQINFFNIASFQDKLYLLILALSKKYELIYDFLIHLHKAFRDEGKVNFSKRDFDIFLDDTSIYHPELVSLSEVRMRKFRQYTFKSLEEARIIDENLNIIPASPSKDLIKVISQKNKRDLLILPLIN